MISRGNNKKTRTVTASKDCYGDCFERPQRGQRGQSRVRVTDLPHFAKEKETRCMPGHKQATDGSPFQRSTSCLALPGRLLSLPRASCPLFLATARRSFRYDSRRSLLLKKPAVGQASRQRPTGVEPASRAWEARVIPLYDGRNLNWQQIGIKKNVA